jgi:hypothetical protein
MNRTTILAVSTRRVQNSLTDGDPAGIIQNIRSKYMKTPMIQFLRAFLDLLSPLPPDQAKRDPESAYRDVIQAFIRFQDTDCAKFFNMYFF